MVTQNTIDTNTPLLRRVLSSYRITIPRKIIKEMKIKVGDIVNIKQSTTSISIIPAHITLPTPTTAANVGVAKSDKIKVTPGHVKPSKKVKLKSK